MPFLFHEEKEREKKETLCPSSENKLNAVLSSLKDQIFFEKIPFGGKKAVDRIILLIIAVFIIIFSDGENKPHANYDLTIYYWSISNKRVGLIISSNILLHAFKVIKSDKNFEGNWLRGPFTLRNLGWLLRHKLNSIFLHLKIQPSYAYKIQKHFPEYVDKLGEGIFLFHSFNVKNYFLWKYWFSLTYYVLEKDEIHFQKTKFRKQEKNRQK